MALIHICCWDCAELSFHSFHNYNKPLPGVNRTIILCATPMLKQAPRQPAVPLNFLSIA